MSKLQCLLEKDFSREFSSIAWQVDPTVERHCANLPNITREVVYFAVRELFRNAANHCSAGEDKLQVSVDTIPGGVQLAVSSSGGQQTASSHMGSGSGLRIHSAMLAAVGARLEIRHLGQNRSFTINASLRTA